MISTDKIIRKSITNLNPLVSIISVNFNGLEDSRELIESLIHVLHTVSYEIIIVDNGSRADEAFALKSEFPSIVALRSEKNLGFAGGNNLGIKQAKGEFLFFINNDTFIREDNLNILLDQLRTNDQLAGASPKVVFATPPYNIQFAGFTDFTKITLRNKAIGYNEPDDGRWNSIARTPFLHGCAMILKRSAIDAVGFMPEIYFLYYEELDWCESFSRSGYQFIYFPSVVVYHKGSKSTGHDSPLKTYYMTRNRLLFAQRNTSGLQKYASISYLLLAAIPAKIIKLSINGNINTAGFCIKGVFDFFKLVTKHSQLSK